MARKNRIKNPSEPTVYHIISRTALAGFPLKDVEKDYFVEILHMGSDTL